MLRAEGFFESEQEVFTSLRNAGFKPRHIVDIGASNGSWTWHCLKIFPEAQFHLYEPLYAQLSEYTQGIDNLTTSHKNVALRNVGLSDEAGVADFFITPDLVGSSLLPVGTATKIQIDVVTLDQERQQIDAPLDIIKMDTQGGELRILQGGRAAIPGASVVVVESWLYRGYGPPTPLAHEIIEEMLRHDFLVFAVGGPYFNPEHVLYAVDLYFARRDILSLLDLNPLS